MNNKIESLIGQFVLLVKERLAKSKSNEEKKLLEEVLKLGVEELENVSKIH